MKGEWKNSGKIVLTPENDEERAKMEELYNFHPRGIFRFDYCMKVVSFFLSVAESGLKIIEKESNRSGS